MVKMVVLGYDEFSIKLLNKIIEEGRMSVLC